MSRFRRTAALLASIALLAPFGCHRQQTSLNGLTPIVLQTDWYPQPEHGGFYEAQQEGLYRAAGLDVTITPGGPYVSAERQVATGAAQFGMGSSDQVLVAASQGLPLVAVAATMQQDPQAVMVHAESPVRTFSDLDGHAIAARPGSIWFQYLVKRYNLKNVREIPATYSISNFLHDPNYIQQIFVTSEPYFAQKQGAQVRSLLISSTGYQPYRVYFTSRQFLQAHPEIVKKFVDASTQGWNDYIADPGPVDRLLQKLNPNMSPDLMQFSIDTLKRDHFLTGDGTAQSHLGHMEPARWDLMYEQLLHLNMLDHPFDPKQAYTLQFAP
jgi:NitT/TauT family transport system substrate-binding protein